MRDEKALEKELVEVREEMWDLIHRSERHWREYIDEINRLITRKHNIQINLNQIKQRRWNKREN